MIWLLQSENQHELIRILAGRMEGGHVIYWERGSANRKPWTASCELEPRQEFTFAALFMTVEVGQHKNPKSLTYINPLYFALFRVRALTWNQEPANSCSRSPIPMPKCQKVGFYCFIWVTYESLNTWVQGWFEVHALRLQSQVRTLKSAHVSFGWILDTSGRVQWVRGSKLEVRQTSIPVDDTFCPKGISESVDHI